MPFRAGRIVRDLRKEIAKVVAREGKDLAKVAVKRYRDSFKKRMKNTETYKVLGQSGLPFDQNLVGLFGIESPAEARRSLVNLDKVVNTKFKSFTRNGNVNFVIELSWDTDELRDRSLQPEGVQVTDKGETLPWLYWLLFEGTNNVIVGAEARRVASRRNVVEGRTYYRRSRAGRSGQGILMFEGPGLRFRVPSQFAGTQAKNVFTKAVDLAKNSTIFDDSSNEFRQEVNKLVRNVSRRVQFRRGP